MKTLFLLPGPVPPEADERLDRFFFLSSVCQGTILLPTWFRTASDAERKLGRGFGTSKPVGAFTYIFFHSQRYPASVRTVLVFAFFLLKGSSLLRSDKYQGIVAYGTSVTGFAGALLSRFTGVPLITEVPGVPDKAFVLDDAHPSLSLRVKGFVSDRIFDFVIASSVAVQLLYPNQLPTRTARQRIRCFVFHAFVPVSSIEQLSERNEILLVGFPWYLKGVDILCNAFAKIREAIPQYELVVMGYVPNKDKLLERIGCTDRIRFEPPRPYPEALRMIAGCAVLVLPSRTEAMGRVLLEAMAAGRPVVASRVDGIPYYVEDGRTGLLFDVGAVDQLAAQLVRLCGSRELRGTLGGQARLHCNSAFSEAEYVRAFGDMLNSVLSTVHST